MNNKLGQILKQARVRKNLRQIDVAKLFRISQPSYHRWESGETVPEPKHFSAIAEFTERTTEEIWTLIYGTDDLVERVRVLEDQMEKLMTFFRDKLT